MAVRSGIKTQELEADRADLVSLKADLRTLYRKLREMGPVCRTKTVRNEVFNLIKLYRALPV